MKLTVNELFAGIGAYSKALDNLAIPYETVGISEIDRFAVQSYNAIHGEVKNYGDIRQIERLDYADLWVYSSPDRLKIQNDNMTNDDFRQFLAKAFGCMDKFMKPGAGFYIWHSDSERYNFQGACNDCGWTVRQCLIWIKNTFVLGRQDYQ